MHYPRQTATPNFRDSSARMQQQRYFAHSQKLAAELWQRRPLIRKVLQNSARLADSLL